MTRLQILVVDDDIGDRKLISRLVARIDATAEVREEESAEAALALPEAPVDAIFLDHRLPTLTGLSALARFRARWPAAALFLMIGQGDEDVAKSAILQGADDYVPKSNINQNALTRMLRTGLLAARLRIRLEEQRADLATFVEVLVHDFRAPIRATMSLSD